MSITEICDLRVPAAWRPAGLLGLCCLVFVIDVLTPLGVADGTLYVTPVLAALWLRGERFAVTTALASSGLIVLGFAVSATGAPLWIALMNRAFGLLAIWLAVALALRLINDLRKSEEERRAALVEARNLESVASLTGGIAHQFNNLLAVVLGNARLALEQLSAACPNRHRLDSIIEAGDRAAALVRQLVALGGRGRARVERLDISAVVRELAASLSATLPGTVALRLDLAPEPPAIEADPAQVEQAISNLIVNSVESITGPGSITIKTGLQELTPSDIPTLAGGCRLDPGEYVFCEVRDSGCGIPDGMLPRIFDPFFSTKFLGRGLGLPAVLGIVRGHNGAIRVSSNAGAGAAVKLYFPTRPG